MTFQELYERKLPGTLATVLFKYFSNNYLYVPTRDFFPIPFFDSQDRGAIREVSELIQSYVKQDRTILLVVVPCTQDVATIEALEWASKADKTGKRTIGVLTKPDLIDDGAENEVAAVLLNKRKPLSLGYVMLKNRSQREILDNLSVEQARESEKDYFVSHPIWSTMDKRLFGIENLISKITRLYVSRIYDAIPSMRQEISSNLNRIKSELKEIGLGAGETPAEANMTLMRLVFEYNNLLNDATAGRYMKKELWNEKFRLCTKVRELYDEFKKEIGKTRPKFESDREFVEEIAEEIRNSRGRELPGFLNPRIFESRIAQYVETWRDASTNLVTRIHLLVRKTSQDLFSSICPDFPGLRQRMNLVISNSVQDLEKQARKEVQGVFDREIGQPFTLNEQFLASVNRKRLERFDAAVVVAMQRSRTDNRGKPNDKDVAKLLRAWYESYHCSGTPRRVEAEAEDLSTMLGCYWNVAADRFVDNLVMALENSFIKPLAQSIHVPMNDIVLRVGKSSEELNSLLREDPQLVKRRHDLIKSKDRLKKALELIENFKY